MWIKLSSILQEIIDQYNLEVIQHDGWVYIKIQKGMPGLKQAGKIDNYRLCTHLKNMDMHQSGTHPPYVNTIQETSYSH